MKDPRFLLFYSSCEQGAFFQEVGYWSKVVILGAALGVGLQCAQAVWTPAPVGDPTTATVSGAIATGAGQIKDGNLILHTGLNGIPAAGNGPIVANGKVGIGDPTPNGVLKVNVEGNVWHQHIVIRMF